MDEVNQTIKSGNPSSSSSAMPDLDWSQVRETVRLLHLAIAQITVSLKEGDESVESLADSFTSMAGGIKDIELLAYQLLDNESKQPTQAMLDKCSVLASAIQGAIIGFQFYDRITQQLTHVCSSLTALGDLVSDPDRLYRPYEWQALQNDIHSNFSLESDRRMFEALVNGASIGEVLEMARQRNSDSHPDNHVELF